MFIKLTISMRLIISATLLTASIGTASAADFYASPMTSAFGNQPAYMPRQQRMPTTYQQNGNTTYCQ
jgi:hypothetical protein